MIAEGQVILLARTLHDAWSGRQNHFKRIHQALNQKPNEFPYWLPLDAPAEIRQLARLSKVNLLGLVVDTVAQSLYVDGYRTARDSDESGAWALWQANGMDARQIALHRAALTYGESYLIVLPGSRYLADGTEENAPIMRAVLAQDVACLWDEDEDEWPMYAIERRKDGTWRVYDDTNYYVLACDNAAGWTLIESVDHNAGVCPVVRYRATGDLEACDKPYGEVTEHLMRLQDQIDITSFGLQVAQHYGAFRQRYIIGWVAESETARLKASASKLWTFEDSPQDITVGEFQQTDLSGYIASREASIRHLASISQTPAHELIGQIVNLSAEALAAAEASQRRKITERQTIMGEAHEQALQLAAAINGDPIDELAEVRWRDTESRALSATVDALGKMVQMLGVPPQELWEQIPNVTQQQIDRWKAAAVAGDPFGAMTSMLSQHAAPAEVPDGEGRQA